MWASNTKHHVVQSTAPQTPRYTGICSEFAKPTSLRPSRYAGYANNNVLWRFPFSSHLAGKNQEKLYIYIAYFRRNLSHSKHRKLSSRSGSLWSPLAMMSDGSDCTCSERVRLPSWSGAQVEECVWSLLQRAARRVCEPCFVTMLR